MRPFATAFVTAGVLLALAGAAVAAGEDRELFNGKDLEGWVIDGPREYKEGGKPLPLWRVEDGRIVSSGRGFGFLRYDRQQFGDFRWHVEYRLAKGGNSGLGIRTCVFDPKKSTATRPSFYSYEIQLLDDGGKPASKGSSGSLYRYVAPKSNPVKPAGEWNTVEVECVGPRIRVWINGEQVHDFDQATVPELKNKPLKGYVCLQSHSLQVEFRNIRLREIRAASPAGGRPAEDKKP